MVIAFDTFCQTPGYREDTSIPTFDINFLIIRSSEKPEKEFEFLKTSLADFLEEFPNPDKNEDYYYEMTEVMARLISYNTSELYFLKNKLSDFRFQDSKFSIGNGENFIKVGDHFSEIEKLYPKYKDQLDSLNAKNRGITFIILSNNKIVLDDGLAILFDLTTGKITEILF
jgi:hypothetical protein